MNERYFFKFATKKAGCKGPDIYNGDMIWDESDGPVHLKFWSGKEYVRLSDIVRNEVNKYMKETNRMSDRPTPETDAAAEAAVGMGHFMVDSDFARKLERERDKLNTDLVEISSKLVVAIRERDETRKELNEIRAERDLARLSSMESDQAHDRMVGELEKVYQELDEAREVASGLAKQAERLRKERDEARGALHNFKCDAVAWEILTKAKYERDRLREAVIKTLDANRHLADGDNCTLAILKSAAPEWK